MKKLILALLVLGTLLVPAVSQASYSAGFNSPNCANNVWARSSWLTPACNAPAWYVEGQNYFSVADASSPSGTKVLTEDPVDYNGSGTSQTWLHTPLGGTRHRVDISVKPIAWGSTASANCSWAGGPKIFLGRQADVYETSTYTVEVNICDGSSHIQKKSWGVNDCGKDPRAVDCGAGGTWYLLAQAHPGVPTMGQWHTFSGEKTDNANGSVTIKAWRDGVLLMSYTEVPGSISLGPLRGGREGWRSNMIRWAMDSFKVTTSTP